jgi:hypothetical protein
VPDNTMQEPTQIFLDDLRFLSENFAVCETSIDPFSETSTNEITGGGLPQASQRDAWSEHEESVYEIIKKAAKLVCVATHSNIIVARPKQPHVYSAYGSSIKPDVIIVIKYNNVMRTIVVDAKNHYKHIPKKDCEKLLRDMNQTQVCKILV